MEEKCFDVVAFLGASSSSLSSVQISRLLEGS